MTEKNPSHLHALQPSDVSPPSDCHHFFDIKQAHAKLVAYKYGWNRNVGNKTLLKARFAAFCSC